MHVPLAGSAERGPRGPPAGAEAEPRPWLGSPGGRGAGASNAANRLRAIEAAWLPFAVGHKAAWWEQVVPPSDEDDETFRATLRSMTEDVGSVMR